MNSSNFSKEIFSAPPTPLLWDYVQIGYFALMVVIGVPLNAYSLIKNLCIDKRSRSTRDSMKILKINFAITDLMILLFFAFSKLIWFSTYQWLGGDLMCKLVHFLLCFAFYSNSNFVALVGLVRWMAVKHLRETVSFFPKHFFLYIFASYCLALCASIPQIFFYRIIYPFYHFPNWAQCITVFEAERWINGQTVDYITENLYQIFHMLFVFWIPFVIIVISYFGVLIGFRKIIKETDQSMIEYYSMQYYVNITTQSTSIVQRDAVPLRSHMRSISTCTLIRAKKCMIKKTALILLVYVLCWSSYNILALLEYLGVVVSGTTYWRLLYNLVAFNAVVNPFIYGL